MAFIGPPLPPGLTKAAQDKEDVLGPSRQSDGGSIGPQLPPGLSSQLATGERGEEESAPKVDSSSSSSLHGPSTSDRSSSSYGPALPPGFKVQTCDEAETLSSSSAVIGPSLPGQASVGGAQGEEEEVIGPMPVKGVVSEDVDIIRRKSAFESRAKAMKDKLLGKDVPSAPKREEWMTELPAEIKPSGIGARKFRTTAVDLGDRSVWTDTPSDRLRKEQEAFAGAAGPRKKEKREKEKSMDHLVAERDKELAQLVQEHNKKHRSQSLMDMHSRKRKKEDQEGKEEERRPFDRERDLQVHSNLITPAKRKALMKDSRTALDSKFTHGSRSFL